MACKCAVVTGCFFVFFVFVVVVVVGALLFLLYINDITDNLGSLARLFADDTSLSYSGKNVDLMQIEINNDLQILDQWTKTWLVDFNPKKPKPL